MSTTEAKQAKELSIAEAQEAELLMKKGEQAPPCSICLWLDKYMKGGLKEMERHMKKFHVN